jgi:hypothetical protein
MKATSRSHKKNLVQWLGLSSKKPKYRYRLVDFKNERPRTDHLLSRTKCNLEILKMGIMVVGDFSGEETIIPVMKNEIESITLVRGKEVVDTFYFSPMHILSKLGLPNRISRHLCFYPWEYKITETRITIRCQDRQLELITGGTRYEKLLRKFKNAGYTDELDPVEKPSLDLLSYTGRNQASHGFSALSLTSLNCP